MPKKSVADSWWQLGSSVSIDKRDIVYLSNIRIKLMLEVRAMSFSFRGGGKRELELIFSK